jgi:hypothetical protein
MRRAFNTVAALLTCVALSACSMPGGGTSVPVESSPLQSMSFAATTTGATITANGRSVSISAATIGKPLVMPWGTLTTNPDGSADFRFADGRTGHISVNSGGSTSVLMPWYSPTAIVLSKATQGGLANAYRAANPGSGSRTTSMINRNAIDCSSLQTAVRLMQEAYNATLVTAIAVVGAGVIADVATMGAALVLVAANAGAIMALAQASAALQDAQDNAAAAGC